MLNFLSRCWVSNWWVVFGSWMQMRSSTKKVSKSLLKVDSIILNNLKERLPGKWKILSELWLRGACIYCGCTNSWQEIMQKRISGDSWASCSSVLTTWLLNELQTVFQVGGLFWLLRMMFYVTDHWTSCSIFFSKRHGSPVLARNVLCILSLYSSTCFR